MPPHSIPLAQARRYLLKAVSLDTPFSGNDPLPVLEKLGCIQLDPIDRFGSNAELVAWARMPGLKRGQLYPTLQGRYFVHFAKEKCLIHTRFLPLYQGQALETPWWRHSERMKKITPTVLEEVLKEIREKGPGRAGDLKDHGVVEALDWSGWSGTKKVAALALEVLWTQVKLVIAAKDSGGRWLYDLPERVFPESKAALCSEAERAEALVVERVRSAGLLSRGSGPHWSMLSKWRSDGTVERLLKAQKLVELSIGKRPYLALPDVFEPLPELARSPRVIGPLDPLLWDRKLVKELFDFEYTWEVYKPAAERQYGYYVVPILWDERLCGRAEFVREKGELRVIGRWGEVPDMAVERLAEANRG
jgi:uncharacterized protein YcaQ